MTDQCTTYVLILLLLLRKCWLSIYFCSFDNKKITEPRKLGWHFVEEGWAIHPKTLHTWSENWNKTDEFNSHWLIKFSCVFVFLFSIQVRGQTHPSKFSSYKNVYLMNNIVCGGLSQTISVLVAMRYPFVWTSLYCRCSWETNAVPLTIS